MEELVACPNPVRHALALLPYADIEAAQGWLVDTFQFQAGSLDRDETGEIVHGEVIAGLGTVHLHPPMRYVAMPVETGTASAIVVVSVEDADTHAERTRDRGAEIIYGPADMPYGMREYGAIDLAGHPWSFQGPPITQRSTP
ncbi:MAG: VOC family protein [Jatrophihabitans sp.]